MTNPIATALAGHTEQPKPEAGFMWECSCGKYGTLTAFTEHQAVIVGYALTTNDTLERLARVMFADIWRNTPGIDYDSVDDNMRAEFRRMARVQAHALIEGEADQ